MTYKIKSYSSGLLTGGNPVDLKKLYKIAEDNNIKIIEDAAHAIGAKYFGEKIGNSKYSEMSIFSFIRLNI